MDGGLIGSVGVIARMNSESGPVLGRFREFCAGVFQEVLVVPAGFG